MSIFSKKESRTDLFARRCEAATRSATSRTARDLAISSDRLDAFPRGRSRFHRRLCRRSSR